MVVVILHQCLNLSMKIKASFDFVIDELDREYYYFVPSHHDKHLRLDNPYFILFVHETTEPLVFMHMIGRETKFECLEENKFYIFDSTKKHAVYPKRVLFENDEVQSCLEFDKLLNDMYDHETDVDHVLVANVFDWQRNNTFLNIHKMLKPTI